MIELELDKEKIVIDDDFQTKTQNKTVLNVLQYVNSLTPDKGYPILVAVELLTKFGAKIVKYTKPEDENTVF